MEIFATESQQVQGYHRLGFPGRVYAIPCSVGGRWGQLSPYFSTESRGSKEGFEGVVMSLEALMQ